MKKFFLLAILAVAASVGLFAQDKKPGSSFVLNLDYARFRYDAQNGYLEVYYAFYPHLLTYATAEGSLHAGVMLSTKIINNATKTMVVNQRVRLPVVVKDTSSASFRHPFTTQAGYALPFGEYTLEVVAADSLNSSRRDSVSLTLDIQPYSETLSISDLELSSRVQPSDKKDDPFFKNSLEVVPNPTLVFGVATYPVVFNYAELYNLSPTATYTVKTQIVAPDGKTMKESSKSRKYGATNSVEAGMINVTSTMPGRYIYRLSLLDETAAELARSEKTFYVYNPHLKPPAAAAASTFQNAPLAGLTAAELDEEFRKARYLAVKEEIKFYAQIESESGKREFLSKFWTAIEAGRGDFPPMKRSEYLRRAETASQSYSSLGKAGWRSDRGRVFILYGEPDQIERFPSDIGAKPYQVWGYNSIEKGVEFIFVDRLGNGDYQLVHSNKRGELQDESWRRYLL